MAKKKALTEEEKKEIAMLQANNEMLLRSIKEAKERKPESVPRIEEVRKEVIAKLGKFGVEADSELEEDKNKSTTDNILDAIIINDKEEDVYKRIENENKKREKKSDKSESVNNGGYVMREEQESRDTDFNDIDPDAQYDVISLPSNGQCYPSKIERVPVGFLTAYDENLITSPNLYKNGLIIDFLVKRKVMNKNIDIDSLVSGDVDAITLFLRATSYGVEFPIVATDPESGEDINTVIDLSKVKYKEFNLVGDRNGWFEYELPVSHDKIKFRYLTRRDLRALEQLSKIEDESSKAVLINETVKLLNRMLKGDKVLEPSQKKDIENTINILKEWQGKLLENDAQPFSKLITNRMEMSIMAVNGNTDREYISKYIKNMGARDSLMLRRYINTNEPGVDWEIEVERPKSLGGGSFKTFLSWDDNVFFNIE